jgi:hypothetical protein
MERPVVSGKRRWKQATYVPATGQQLTKFVNLRVNAAFPGLKPSMAAWMISAESFRALITHRVQAISEVLQGFGHRAHGH